MPKDEPTWKLVYEAAKKLDAEFTPIEIIREIHRTHPDAKANTIRCHVFGMSENHPSSKHYAYLRRKHPYLWYLGDGKFRLRTPKDHFEDSDTSQEGVIEWDHYSEWPWPSNREKATIDRMRDRVEELNAGFQHYLDVLTRNNPFRGPQISYHRRTLELLRKHTSIKDSLEDEEYLGTLHRTLDLWGMNSRAAELIDYEGFKKALRDNSVTIEKLRDKKLLDLKREEVGDASKILLQLVDDLKISKTNSQLVAGAKTLHHVLPELIPPIDRNYTMRFFYGSFEAETVSIYSSEQLCELLPMFHFIGEKNREVIRRVLDKNKDGFFTSETKMIDNAIIGYIIEKWGKLGLKPYFE
jgi:hypothetical protein